MAYNGFDYEENDNEVKCPICGSHSVTAVGKKKGFGVGKALIGAALVATAFAIPAGIFGRKLYDVLAAKFKEKKAASGKAAVEKTEE